MVANPFRSRRETRRRVRETVDAEPDAEALRGAAAEETAGVAESGARRARRRDRKSTTSEDVARTNERYQDREERGRRRYGPITDTLPARSFQVTERCLVSV